MTSTPPAIPNDSTGLEATGLDTPQIPPPTPVEEIVPNVNFDEILHDPIILENFKKMGFSHPTPIQVAVAGPISEGKNLFAGAKTGSGKTIAFLAPLAERLLKGDLKYVLVIAPTRELVLQMDEEAMRMLDGQSKVVSIPLYGGVPADPQILALKHHKPRILIVTPGRCLDLVQEGFLPLSEVDVAVLDEADRMCDMGFAPQVESILDLLISRKQTLLFSATLPKELNGIMERFCPNPVRVQVDDPSRASETIEHEAIMVSRKDKARIVLSLVDKPDATTLVFARTRNRADELHRALSRSRRDIGILHAGFSMPERERTIRDFREGKIKALIATDVVARGIDIDRITQVVHFDLPDQIEDYIHRSGRSGRAGRAGETIALVERDSREQVQKMELFGKKIHFKMAADSAGRFSEGSSSENEGFEQSSERRPSRGRRPHNAGAGAEGGRSRGGRGGRGAPAGGRANPIRNAGADGYRRTPHADSAADSSGHSKAGSHSHSRRGSATGSSHAKPRRNDRPAHDKASSSKATAKPKSLLAKTKSLLGRVFGTGKKTK